MSGSRNGERMVHQDFIARIRYSNTLPPPPNPPKLLEIPNTGLESGHYTSPGFATRLSREHALNIEVDAELGMPLDLIGMPGVFDGDESSIQSLPRQPAVHPHDRALLKPLSSLGKPRTSEAAVSFLRRTEYIASMAHKMPTSSGALRASGGGRSSASRKLLKRASPEPDAGTPAYVKRKIEKSFEAAAMAARDNYAHVKHPTKKKAAAGAGVRLVGAYPLLPDLGAFPDSGAYVTIKFKHNPVVAGSNVYDTRLLSGVFKPVDQTDEERAVFEVAQKAYERDPIRNPRPQNQMRYEFYLPDTTGTGEAFRHEFSGSGDDDDKFTFRRVRAYESAEEKELTHATKYAEEILLAFADDALAAAPDLGGSVAGGPRAALYYPVMQRTEVQSMRSKLGRTGLSQTQFDNDDDNVGDRVVDRLQVSVHDPPEDMREHIARIRADPLHFDEHEEEEEAEAEERRRRRRHDEDEDDDRRRSSSPVENGRRREDSGEPDADGEEE